MGTTLGAGYTAKVKIAINPEGQEFAVKIFDLSKANVAQLMTWAQSEFELTRENDHKHIVKYYEFCENRTLTKKDG